jgi:AraC-like DNA-binding protein
MPHLSKCIYQESLEQFKIPLFIHNESNTGFEQYKLIAGELFRFKQKKYNQLFFLLKGKLVVNSSEVLGRIVSEGEFFFLPIPADISLKALLPCNLVIFFFDQFRNSCERNYIRDLRPICTQNKYQFQVMDMRYPLPWLINNMTTYLDKFKDNTEYQQVKYEEFFYLLRTMYSKEEMAALFYPIVGESIEFRKFIMANYLQSRNIHELAGLSGLKRKTFDRQFYEEFGETPHKWVLKQKAKHIRYALSETNDSIQDIMKKYGFAIPAHFTRFCRDYFNCTPLELRKRLKMEKLQRF